MAVSARPDPLARYRQKRDFGVTTEPSGDATPAVARIPAQGNPRVKAEAPSADKLPLFVVQKHAASRLHYDFRLELDGVLVSWAVPKGPSLDPAVKRMAVHVEDHPLPYGSFEGTIPAGQYGAGSVIVWDTGTWKPEGDAQAGIAAGKLAFTLDGRKLHGLWELIRTRGRDKQEQWLLFKKRDRHARASADHDVVMSKPDSVLSASNGVRAASVLPATLSPQLATLATDVPASGSWTYEVKFDGYRLMVRIDGGRPALITRGGHDWTARLPDLAAAIERLGIESAWLDGEIVMLDNDGLPDFNALQNAFERPAAASAIVYFVFDAPFLDGEDLRGAPLAERRQRLAQRLRGNTDPHVRFSAGFEATHGSALESACAMNLEGLIAKRIDAPYVSRRSETWLKLKCRQRQEFVVCGYVERGDGSPQIGSLALGVYDDGATDAAAGNRSRLVPAGSVGTGWSAAEARKLKTLLAQIPREVSPFAPPPGGAARTAHHRWSRNTGDMRWVEPTQVAEVTFAGWTPEGSVRHASYVALRSDKAATEVRRERPKDARSMDAGSAARPAAKRASRQAPGKGLRISHGGRVVDVASGTTKLALVRYYESVADWILPHLEGRPVSLVRGPDGVGGTLFFQKHGGRIAVPGITELDPSLWPGHTALMAIDDAQALAGAAQMNVIELHTWNSTVRSIDTPDRMVFDLDPGEGVPWQHVLDSAALVRSFLLDLGLEGWLKTSGGKGLHVVVPLTPKAGYAEVKDVSRAIVQHLAKTVPSRFVAKSGADNRKGKLFVDYLRNGQGATTASAFSARARPGMGVSMPVDWADLPALTSGDQWTVATARDHLSFQSADPWSAYWKKRQTLATALRLLPSSARATPRLKKAPAPGR